MSRTRMAKLFLFGSVIFLFFFRPESAWKTPQVWDDSCYFEWLLEMVGLGAPMCPAYEYFGQNYYFPGSPLAWAPLAFLAKGWASLTGSDALTWIHISVGVSSFLFWMGAVFFLAAMAKKQTQSLSIPILFLLTVPVLHYATVRTFMSHSAEFFLATACICALVHRKHLLSLALAIWLVLTRLNDAPIFLMLLGYWIDQVRKPDLERKERILIRVLLVGAFACGLFALKFAVIDGYAQLGPEKLLGVLRAISLSELMRALFGKFGMSWTAFFWLSLLILGALNFRRLTYMGRGGLVWMFSMFLICVGWEGHGGDSFAYRYTIGTYVGAWIVFLELYKMKPAWEKYFLGSLAIQATIMTVFTWVYNSRFHLNPSEIGSWPIKIIQSILLAGVGALGVSVNGILHQLGWETGQPIESGPLEMKALLFLSLIFVGIAIYALGALKRAKP